jgi:hypothetical protein
VADETARSLGNLLAVLTDKQNRHARQEVACFGAQVRADFEHSYTANIRACRLDRGEHEAATGLLLTFRLLWRLIPTELFESPDPDYERLAYEACLTEFGDQQAPRLLKSLSTIFRRLRHARLNTGKKTSLDLSNVDHWKLFVQQQQSCAVCLYPFPELPELALYDNELTFVEEYHPVCSEICLDTYHRRPHLDHIIPYFLGGDGIENWQILCHSCNTGKGDALSWLTRRGWMPPSRVSDALGLTPSLRYACLAAFRESIESINPRKGACLRLFKKRSDRLVYFDNLEVKHC